MVTLGKKGYQLEALDWDRAGASGVTHRAGSAGGHPQKADAAQAGPPGMWTCSHCTQGQEGTMQGICSGKGRRHLRHVRAHIAWGRASCWVSERRSSLFPKGAYNIAFLRVATFNYRYCVYS